ncbi:MAG TPA: chromosomal replication initiator protein DnaA [Patescibacteria group bacterium]
MADHFLLSEAEVKEIWHHTCNSLQLQVSPAVFNTWILSNPVTKIELIGDDQAVCTITSPTAFHSTNYKKNLGAQVSQALQDTLGRQVELTYVVGTPITTETQKTQPLFASSSPMAAPSSSAPRVRNSAPPAGSNTPAPAAMAASPRVEDLFSQNNLQAAALDRAQVVARQAGLRADYTFETFAVSTTNEMAHAAATAVSQRPGTAYNPLFLYGGVGVGKTHLMHAIGNNIIKTDPSVTILYCTGEEFTNEIVNAIQTKKALRFKEKYRKAQVLLIDDVQFIAGKTAVQEEFFHTFNALIQQAHQIVLTSDRPPHEINLIEDRLRSRFEAGLMIDIGQPSFELRTAILLIKSQAVNLHIPMDVAQLIASKVDSARRIEGIIKSLKSAVELQKKEISANLVEEILRSEGQPLKQRLRVTPQDVIKAVANHYHVKQAAIKGKRRVQSLVTARHVAMFLLKEDLSLPLTEVARWFSNRDHTTALHATRKIEEQMKNDSLLQRDVSALRMSLSAISR